MRTPMINATLILVLAGTSMSRADCPGRVQVAQESGASVSDFDANVIAAIEPYTTTLTAEAYYFFDGQNPNSFGPAPGEEGPPIASNRVHLFMLDAADGLSLVHVYDDDDDASTGRADTRYEIIGDTADFTARDGNPGDDIYVNMDGTLLTADHQWGSFRTDGLAIGSLDGAWGMRLQFDDFAGLGDWLAFSADDSGTPLVLAVDRRVRLLPIRCEGDVDANGAVDFADLNIILGNWGTLPDPCTRGDADADGDVDFTDLNIVLGNWGTTCQ